MILFDQSMRMLKGNTHTHTTMSDGKLTPEEAARQYRQHGYDFIVQTDHWKHAPERVQDGLLVLQGTEFDVYSDNQPTAHIVAVGVTEEILEKGLSKQSDAQDVVDAINENGGAAILAHPAWSMNTPQFMASLKGIIGAEIYNTCSGTPWNAERADSSSLLDVTSAQGTLLPLVAADDSHFYNGEQCRSYIMLQADSCDSASILAALKSGRFYASQGPRFEYVEVTDDRLIIRCSPVERITFYSNLPWVTGRNRICSGIQEAEYVFEKQRVESYVRCEIVDAAGAKAWLSPIRISR